jgi:hypothetical protein
VAIKRKVNDGSQMTSGIFTQIFSTLSIEILCLEKLVSYPFKADFLRVGVDGLGQ